MDRGIWRAYAVRYGQHTERTGADNFIGGDPHEGPMPLDFFVWVIENGERTILVDTGFDANTAQSRQRQLLRCPGDGVRALGIDPGSVGDVIITHMHWDHSGNHDLFPAARYHLQDKEMAYCTGRHMCQHTLRRPFGEDDVVAMVRRVYSGKLQFHDGDEEIAAGVSVHHIGGHTMGLQVVRVRTERGYVVIASDAAHYYGNIERAMPFPIVYNVADMLEGHRRLTLLASSQEHVIPGHDPLVLRRYPAPRSDLDGWIARLDVAPAI